MIHSLPNNQLALECDEAISGRTGQLRCSLNTVGPVATHASKILFGLIPSAYFTEP